MGDLPLFTYQTLDAAGEAQPIRHVGDEEGHSVFRFGDGKRRDNRDIVAGEMLTALRSFSCGCLRDPERSTDRVADAAYGTRFGQPYPLWNWCIRLCHFPVSE